MWKVKFPAAYFIIYKNVNNFSVYFNFRSLEPFRVELSLTRFGVINASPLRSPYNINLTKNFSLCAPCKLNLADKGGEKPREKIQHITSNSCRMCIGVSLSSYHNLWVGDNIPYQHTMRLWFYLYCEWLLNYRVHTKNW